MSRRVDEERRAMARDEAVKRGSDFARKLTRMVELYRQGLTDKQVSQALGAGFSLRAVKGYRKFLKMRWGRATDEQVARSGVSP